MCVVFHAILSSHEFSFLIYVFLECCVFQENVCGFIWVLQHVGFIYAKEDEFVTKNEDVDDDDD